ncbi:hypothetical protein KIF59_08725 [Enterobacter cloacae subsp. cloacae]|nr:hypothetical protein [Enterobacter cloacae subsp. cloacae]
MQHNRGAALLHYGAHDNAFWGVLKLAQISLYKNTAKDGLIATLIEVEDLVTTTTMTNLES